MSKIDIMYFEDWITIYKDGKRVWGDHRCEPDQLLRIIGIEFTEHSPEWWKYEDESSWDAAESSTIEEALEYVKNGKRRENE